MKFFKISILSIIFLISFYTYSMDNEKYYIGGLVGVAFPNNFYHQGWNEDTACYPDMAGCPENHKGYTWLYEISNKWMPGTGIYAGIHTNNNWRWELSVDGTMAVEDSNTDFISIHYLKEKGRPYEKPSFWSDVIKSKKAEDLTANLNKIQNKKDYKGTSFSNTFSELKIINFLANVYYTLPIGEKIIPYIGVGLGYGLVSAHIKYKATYAEADKDYNGEQNDTISTGALALRLSAGLDYLCFKHISFGVKLAYTSINELSAEIEYKTHINQKSASLLLTDMNYFTAAVTSKYFF